MGVSISIQSIDCMRSLRKMQKENIKEEEYLVPDGEPGGGSII